jgi:ASC-1-like (ASCH) protein
MNYKDKYIKYKTKYLELENQIGGKKLKKKYFKECNIKYMENDLNNIEPNYTENVSEPWYTLISLGLKTVEGRKNKGRFKEMKVGDIVKWINNDFMPRSVLTRITDKVEYSTFREYLETEGLDNCLPGIPSLEHGLSVYFKYFTKEDEAEFGVIAIKLELVK